MIAKRNLISLILIALSVSAMAFSGLKITMTNGSVLSISFSDQPVVKFVGEKLVINTVVSATELDRSKLKTFNYIEASSLDDINDGRNIINNSGDNLLIENLPVNSEITIYDISGKLIKCAIVEGNYKINISDLLAGVYVVSINGVSTKITIK